MSCCGGNKPKPMFRTETSQVENKGVIGNLAKAGVSQSKPFHWFKDGLKGLIKCMGTKSKYPDEQIELNRSVCRDCEHSTKNSDGKLYVYSQCLAPDPTKDGAACGCFITCKSQIDTCPLGKWVILTVKNQAVPPNKNSQPEI